MAIRKQKPRLTRLKCARAKRPEAKVKQADLSALVETWQARLKCYLAEKHLKFSQQREHIVAIVIEAAKSNPRFHFGAQELVKKVQVQFPKIGPATVYRNLKLLCEAKILSESMDHQNNGLLYEVFSEQHHDHIVCLDCGEIFEFEDHKIEKLQYRLLERLKFKEQNHQHVIYAQCIA